MTHLFADRAEAGRALAGRVSHFRAENPVVLALPRGGVPVAYEVAKALGAPLDLLMVRKISAPDQPELALGAVVDGPRSEVVLNEEIVRALGVSNGFIREAAADGLAEIARRRRVYLCGRPHTKIEGRTVIVVDDGIATGASVRAALRAARRQQPQRLVLAVPVAPEEMVVALEDEVDEVVCLLTPKPFYAIGLYYSDFRQFTDREVTDILDRAAAMRGAAS